MAPEKQKLNVHCVINDPPFLIQAFGLCSRLCSGEVEYEGLIPL